MGLNPCFVGKCSTRTKYDLITKELAKVLILVLLENALREVLEQSFNNIQKMS